MRVLGGRGGAADIEPITIYARAHREVFVSRQDEANGHTRVRPGRADAEILINDFPILGTLLFANRRTSRPIDYGIGGFDVLEALPPPDGATTFADVSGMVVDDAFGQFFQEQRSLGHVDLFEDGSARIRIRGGAAISLLVTDREDRPIMFPEGSIFTGPMLQREAMQFYPGEDANQSIPRRFFNNLCGGCPGSMSGRQPAGPVAGETPPRAAPAPYARDDEPVDLTGM